MENQAVNTLRPIMTYIIAAVLSVAVISGIVWLIIVATQTKQGIEIVIVPEQAKISIKGEDRSIKNGSRVALDVGTYDIKFYADEFATVNRTVTVSKDKISTIYVDLKPLTAKAKAMISDNKSLMLLEQIVGSNLEVDTKESNKKYPFTTNLPIYDKYFYAYSCNIDDSDSSKGLKICVDLVIDEPFYRELALDTLSKSGIDTDSVEITFALDK